MEKKKLVCGAFFMLAFPQRNPRKEKQRNGVVKHCEQVIQGRCDDDKTCFAPCKNKFNTTEKAFCIVPDKQACNCYYTCDEGPISDCMEDIKLEGCNDAMCYGECVGKVKGAMSGSCLPGNHICECFIPC